MKRLALCMSGLVTIAAAGCADDRTALDNSIDVVATATADLRSANGRVMGTATATQSGDSIRVRIKGMNLQAGAHGAHVHMAGVCAPPAFESAGGHWNPTRHQHGKDNPSGMHKGDLPNILIGTDGHGTLEYTIPGTWLVGGAAPMLDSDGAALVIHAGPDDYRTDPSGNSGGRIACGAFR